VLRGGAYGFVRGRCRSASRNWIDPDIGFGVFGFRVVVEVPPKTP